MTRKASIAYSGINVQGSSVPPSPVASVVIRTYNEERYLGDVLGQVAKQQVRTARPVQVILVDSGSTDTTLDIARNCGAVIVSIPKENFTFGRSLNMGCDAAGGEFLVFLSGHCIPTDNMWLDRLILPFQNPATALTYGRQIGGQASKFSETRVFEKYYPDGPPSQGPAFCNNANSAVRRSIWRRFRFDESLTGLEDMDLGRKVVRAGFRIEYCPAAVVTHIHNETWPQVRRRFEREAIALRHIHPEIHLTLFEATACFFSALRKDLQALSKTGRPCGCFLEIVAFRFNQFLGSWLGTRPHRELSVREKARYFFPS